MPSPTTKDQLDQQVERLDSLQPLPVRGFYVLAGTQGQRDAVRGAAFANLAAPFVLTTQTLMLHTSPLVGWIFAGLKLTAIYTLLTLTCALIDAAFKRRRDYGTLTALGTQRTTLTGVIVWETAAHRRNHSRPGRSPRLRRTDPPDRPPEHPQRLTGTPPLPCA